MARATAGRAAAEGAPLILILVLVALFAGCGNVDLGLPPADVNACRPSPSFFTDKVFPEFLDKDYGGKHCGDSRCHDPASPRSLVVTRPTSAPAVPLPADWAALYKSVTEQTQCTNVKSSEILTRPSGQRTHQGGKLIEPDGPEALIIQMWVGMR